MADDTTLYDLVGGDQFFRDLTDRFYDGVAEDPVLRPLYPEDLEPSRHWLALFLVQYWGGPATYLVQRGHPRLRMRHMPFKVGADERDRWYRHMEAAVKAAGLVPEAEQQLLDYFAMAATHLINSED
jgi:hemoglobin